MWSTQFGFPYMPFLAFSSPAVWCRVFQCRVFQSCSFDCAMFSGLAFSVPPFHDSITSPAASAPSTTLHKHSLFAVSHLYSICISPYYITGWVHGQSPGRGLQKMKHFNICKTLFMVALCNRADHNIFIL